MATPNGQRRRLATLPDQEQVELALRRLARVVALEHEFADRLNDAGLRLLRTSAFAAYCDCRALGVEHRAAAILADRAMVRTRADAMPTETANAV